MSNRSIGVYSFKFTDKVRGDFLHHVWEKLKILSIVSKNLAVMMPNPFRVFRIESAVRFLCVFNRPDRSARVEFGIV